MSVLIFDFGKIYNKFLILLLVTDFVFILLHCLFSLHFISDPLFSIGRDFGYAEIYQYIKEYWIMLLLFGMAIKRKHLVYFAWSLLFLYFLLDDSLQIHERLGSDLANYFEFQSVYQLRALDYGELVVSMFFGVFLFSFIGFSYLYSDSTAKLVSKHLFILILFMVFFGVLVDMVHSAIPWGKSISGLIEDGGEMMIMSVILWYVFDLELSSEESTFDHERNEFENRL